MAAFEGHFVAEGLDQVAGWAFRHGRLDDVPLVAVEAGIGKVNAAMVTSLLADRFGCAGLVFAGVAGGLAPSAQVGDVVIATSAIQHDYGAIVADRLVRYQPGAFPLPGTDQTHGYRLHQTLHDRLIALADTLSLPPVSQRGGARPTIHLGAILTGDQFLNCPVTRDRLHGQTGALAVEMEGAAMAQVAERFGLPWAVIRIVSDLAGEDSHLDFSAFIRDAAASSAEIVRRCVPLLAQLAGEEKAD
jgi:adenosylhomocysteine nucleosidase